MWQERTGFALPAHKQQPDVASKRKSTSELRSKKREAKQKVPHPVATRPEGAETQPHGQVSRAHAQVPRTLEGQKEDPPVDTDDVGGQSNRLGGNAKQPYTTRSGRKVRPPQRLIEIMNAEIEASDNSINGELFTLPALFPADESSSDLHVMKASTDPDTMYHHEAMRQPDRAEFIKAMQKEVQDQMQNGNFTIMQRSKVKKAYCLRCGR